MGAIEMEQAIEVLLMHAPAIQKTETITLLSSLHRVCAEDVKAGFDSPPFDRSPLDGFAFFSGDTVFATPQSPAQFTIVGEVCAGQTYAEKVRSGEAVRIMTGGKMPVGCDCVVRQEDISVKEDQLFVPMVLQHEQNYIFQGEDIQKGNVLVPKGTLLKAVHIGILASMGYDKVKVYVPLRIAVCSTGDELVDIGQPLPDGKIYNSNLYTLTARLQELGLDPLILGIAEDEPTHVAEIIRRNIDAVDVFLTTGGVSIGKKDIMHEVLPCLGAERLFWRVSMKPGMPILAYTYKGKLGIALSGNPFAALATFELLVRPALAKISRQPGINYQRGTAVLADDFLKASKTRRFIRAEYAVDKVHIPAKNHSSGALFSAIGCNAMIDIAAATPCLHKGMRVEIIKL